MTQVTKKQKPIRLDVDASLLEWAMNRSGNHADKLSKRQHLKDINKWLAGTKKPTMVQLEKFANATYTPFGYLLFSEPPQECPSTIPHFRTADNDNVAGRSINLEDTIRIVERRQEWIRDYLIEIGVEPLEFVGSSSVKDDPADIAGNIRTALGLDNGWAAHHSDWTKAQRHLHRQIEDRGIFVSRNSMVQNNRYRLLSPEEFRGFVLVDKYAPFLFVNGADVSGAQMFTLVHGLAHIWMGESASFDLRSLAVNPNNRLETACSKIAAEFLIPTEEMRQNWDHFNSSANPYRAASKHFKVSRIVAARRALDAGLVSQTDFEEYYQYHMRKEMWLRKKKRRLPSFSDVAPHDIGKRFLSTVITAIGEKKLLYTEAYLLTGLKSERFDQICDRIKTDMHQAADQQKRTCQMPIR